MTGIAGVVAAIAFVPVAGFFTTGTSAKIPLGSNVTAFLDEDITVAFAPTPAVAAPMMVQQVSTQPAATVSIPQPVPAVAAAAPNSPTFRSTAGSAIRCDTCQ